MGQNSQAFDLKDGKCETITFIDSIDGLEKYREIILEGKTPKDFEVINAKFSNTNTIYVNCKGGLAGMPEEDLYNSKPSNHFKNIKVELGGNKPLKQGYLVIVFYWIRYSNGEKIAAPKTTGESILVGI